MNIKSNTSNRFLRMFKLFNTFSITILQLKQILRFKYEEYI